MGRPAGERLLLDAAALAAIDTDGETGG